MLLSGLQQVVEVWPLCVQWAMTLCFLSGLDKLPHLCAAWVSTGHSSVHTHCRGRGSTSVASLQSVLLRRPSLFILALRSQSLCLLLTEEWDSIFVCVWLLEVVRFVCVGQMACGSNPKWNRPSFVGDIMTYLQWFLEGVVALTLFPWFVQQSGTFQKQFFLLEWDLKVVVVCRRLCS